MVCSIGLREAVSVLLEIKKLLLLFFCMEWIIKTGMPLTWIYQKKWEIVHRSFITEFLCAVKCFVLCMMCRLLSRLAKVINEYCYITRLGCMAMCMHEEPKIHQCYLDHIAVDSNYRGKGIGKIFLDIGDEEARKHHCSVSPSFSCMLIELLWVTSKD